MSHTPHELVEEFPADAALIARLKGTDAHFARLAQEHHATNRAIHRIEAEAEAASDERLEALKKQRLALLDVLAGELARARGA